MNRFQFFRSSKYFNLHSRHSFESSKKRGNGQYDTHIDKLPQLSENDRLSLSLLDLPPKVLAQVFEDLDISTLLSLCMVNSQLYEIISNYFLYHDVVLRDKLSLLQFNALIHSEFRTSNALLDRHDDTIKSLNIRFLVKAVEFRNPQCQDALLKYGKFHNKKGQTSLIGGSYSFDNNIRPISTNSRSPSLTRSQSNTSLRSGLNQTAVQDNGYAITFDSSKQLNKMESEFSHYTYIELMLSIIDHLPNVCHVRLTDVEPNFKIPLWYSVFNDGTKDFFKKIINGQESINAKDLRTFEISSKFISDYERKCHTLNRFRSLEIRANTDKKGKQIVHLRPNMFSCFGIFNELILQNIIIDTESLDTPLEFIPFHLRLEESGVYDLHSPVQGLVLNSCTIVPGGGILKLFHDYFKCVKNLKMLNLTSKYDMLLCNCFTSLTDLTIDCNSPCFINQKVVNDDYYYDNGTSGTDHNLDSDCSSFTETLFDEPVNERLLAPPPTSSIVLSSNLNYLPQRPNKAAKKDRSLITKSQSEYFQQMRIPPFHFFYHYFKQLWDRLPRKNININIINVPFTNVFPLPPQIYCEKTVIGIDDDQQTLIPNCDENNTSSEADEDQNYWEPAVRKCFRDCLEQYFERQSYTSAAIMEEISRIDPEIFNNYKNSKCFRDIPYINLWSFLKSLSEFKSVKIQMLRKWLFCTPRSRYDWELLLKPVLNVNVPIEVCDKDGVMLYSYGTKSGT